MMKEWLPARHSVLRPDDSNDKPGNAYGIYSEQNDSNSVKHASLRSKMNTHMLAHPFSTKLDEKFYSFRGKEGG